MECNNILLDYYKQKREKTLGYQGSQLLSAGEGRCAEGLRAAVSRRGALGSVDSLEPRAGPAWPAGTEHRGCSAGCSEPPLCSPDISQEPQHPPGKLLSLIISVSLQWWFLGCFVSGHTLV